MEAQVRMSGLTVTEVESIQRAISHWMWRNNSVRKRKLKKMLANSSQIRSAGMSEEVRHLELF